MSTRTIFFGTNRKHMGKDRWKPSGYGKTFSGDGRENLRFGKVELSIDDNLINSYLKKKTPLGTGDGNGLAKYIKKSVRRNSRITAYQEKLDATLHAREQGANAVYGSQSMFRDVQTEMLTGRDVVVFVHGFNVAWSEALGSAFALQELFNRKSGSPNSSQHLTDVVLFSWPSDGKQYPFHSYGSDRKDAEDSGLSFGRGLLLLRRFLRGLSEEVSAECNQKLHLICHSMGNYLLQFAFQKIIENFDRAVPRLFDNVFLCAPDIDDDVFEHPAKLGRIHELTKSATVYFNRGDLSMYVSDFTKGNQDRLGSSGVARPSQIHSKIHQVDCSEIVKGFIEHSYYLSDVVSSDILSSIRGESQAGRVNRRPEFGARSSWILSL